MFSSPTQPAQGVSAVKALQIATSQGQRIYHITSQNQAQVLPQLRLDGLALNEINQALATGKEVITHTDRISVPGWTGEGYILFDPDTGSGAYKIAGGANGGFLDAYPGDLVSLLLFFISLISFLQVAPLAAVIVVILYAIALFHLFITLLKADLLIKESGCPEALSVLLLGLSAAFFFLPKFLKDKMFTLVISFYSFVLPRTVGASAPACKNL